MKNTCLLLAIFFAGCAAHINPAFMPLEGKNSFDKEGHRGCRGLMPENTIPAFIKAVDLNVTTLEMDAMITKDKKVIISHDPYFNHDITTKPDGSYLNPAEEKSYTLYNMNYEDVLKYDVGMKPNPHFPQQQKLPAVKPLLSSVIDSVEAYCVSPSAIQY